MAATPGSATALAEVPAAHPALQARPPGRRPAEENRYCAEVLGRDFEGAAVVHPVPLGDAATVVLLPKRRIITPRHSSPGRGVADFRRGVTEVAPHLRHAPAARLALLAQPAFTLGSSPCGADLPATAVPEQLADPLGAAQVSFTPLASVRLKLDRTRST